jgi:hypothetical protein
MLSSYEPDGGVIRSLIGLGIIQPVVMPPGFFPLEGGKNDGFSQVQHSTDFIGFLDFITKPPDGYHGEEWQYISAESANFRQSTVQALFIPLQPDILLHHGL